jgi:hypothetical protein
VVKILAIDPGVTSGYCLAYVEPRVKMTYFAFQLVDDVDDLWRRLHEYQPRYIVMEDFEFRQGRQSPKINLFPKELIGVARLYSQMATHQVALELQSAMTGKSYYKDDILKREKLYKRGIPHAMDASRHLLHWVTFGPGYALNQNKGTVSSFASRVEHPKLLELV